MVNMTNEERTKSQLINELNKLRRQNSKLKSLSQKVPQNLMEPENIKKMKRLELLLNNNPAVIYSCEYGGNLAATFISGNIKEIFGYEASEFIENPNTWVDGVHPEDKKRVIANLDNLMKNKHHSHEYRFLHKDGNYRWIHDEIRVIRDKDRNPLECIGYLTDITEYRNVVEKLRESEDKYRQLFTNELDAIVIFDAESYQFIDVNQTALNLYGYSKEEFLKLKLTDISAELEKTVESVVKTREGNIASIPLRYHKKKDGSKFPVEISPGGGLC